MMWRKRQTRAKLAPNVHHNEQKQDTLSDPLDLLHEENVRLGLYDGVYDLSIKSDNLSIKSKEHMKYKDIKDFYQRCEEHPDHQSGMITEAMIQQRLHEEIDELREYIEQKLKENT